MYIYTHRYIYFSLSLCTNWSPYLIDATRFAPGEPLPPGFMVVAHPEGHTEPQAFSSALLWFFRDVRVLLRDVRTRRV